jgi:hypothetical protein
MNKPNFDEASERLVPSELRVTASEDAEEQANADLESNSEEKDIADILRPIEQSEQWHDDYISRSSGEESSELEDAE